MILICYIQMITAQFLADSKSEPKKFQELLAL